MPFFNKQNTANRLGPTDHGAPDGNVATGSKPATAKNYVSVKQEGRQSGQTLGTRAAATPTIGALATAQLVQVTAAAAAGPECSNYKNNQEEHPKPQASGGH